MCDPFGRSDPDSVICYGSETVQEHNYIFFFDQEPIHLNLHLPTFDLVYKNTADITNSQTPNQPRNKQAGYLCTSERDSDIVQAICDRYHWKPIYYFFHGWAALDWYRGYDKTFLIQPWTQRRPTKTFIAPNRIIAGQRHHRLEMLYWIFKLGLVDNHISCPITCPAENISIYDAINTLDFNDAGQVFRSVNLPLQYQNETDHPMHSCWLSLFDQSADSLLYLVTETVASGRRHHITEKTFKPIALGMPFVLVSTAGSLSYLRHYGFKTFDSVWDESYDLETNDHRRIEKIAQLLQHLNQLSVSQRQDLFVKAYPIIEHNWNHFYKGGFEHTLWQELQDMLHGIKV